MPTLTANRVTDETGLIDYHRVGATVFATDFVALPADPLDDLRLGLTGVLNGQLIEFWTLCDGVDAVAAMTVRAPLHDNLDVATIAVDVHPDHRLRGVGRAAAESALARVRELGRTRVFGEVPTATRTADPAPGEALARSLGATPKLAERRRLLELATLGADRLESLRVEAAGAAAGYSVMSWRDRTPPEYVDDMARLNALMSTDPPQGDLDLEPEVWTADRYLQREAEIQARGRRWVCTTVREDATGRLVGFTDIGIAAGDGEIGFQWATVIDRPHRGHRLGLLIKAVNLQWMQEQLPVVRYVNTWNADDNPHMIAINELLGYREMEGWTEWGLEL